MHEWLQIGSESCQKYPKKTVADNNNYTCMRYVLIASALIVPVQ